MIERHVALSPWMMLCVREREGGSVCRVGRWLLREWCAGDINNLFFEYDTLHFTHYTSYFNFLTHSPFLAATHRLHPHPLHAEMVVVANKLAPRIIYAAASWFIGRTIIWQKINALPRVNHANFTAAADSQHIIQRRTQQIRGSWYCYITQWLASKASFCFILYITLGIWISEKGAGVLYYIISACVLTYA